MINTQREKEFAGQTAIKKRVSTLTLEQKKEESSEVENNQLQEQRKKYN